MLLFGGLFVGNFSQSFIHVVNTHLFLESAVSGRNVHILHEILCCIQHKHGILQTVKLNGEVIIVPPCICISIHPFICS